MSGTAGRRRALYDQAIARLTGNRAASKGEKGAGGGRTLPMLVRTGALRDAVTAGRARVERMGDRIRITWTGLPDYAPYLHNGTARMPARSPINPNAADKARIIAAARRFLSGATGTGGAVPVGGAPGPAARVR